MELTDRRDVGHTDGVDIDEVLACFLRDTEHDDAIRTELVTLMESILARVSDHASIDRDESVWCCERHDRVVVVRELDDHTITRDDDTVVGVAEGFGVLCIAMEHVGEAINRHVYLWTQERDHFFRVLGTCVSTGVDFGLFVLVDAGALEGDDVEESLDRPFITRDDRRAEDDDIVGLQTGVVRLSGRDTHERGVALTLCTRTADRDLAVW